MNEESIDDRMNRIDLSHAGLETIDSVHCVLDKKRTLAFMEAIEEMVKPGDVVVEAGFGTGILAVMAASLGAKVYGIEINKETFQLAQDIVEFFIKKGLLIRENIWLVCADVTSWKPPEEIDVLISENIYAGMFYEMQILIVNHLLEFLSSSGRVVPECMSSYVILAQTELPARSKQGDSFSPSLAEDRIYRFMELSDPVLYDKIDFYQKNDLALQVSLEIRITKAGLDNTLLIYSPITVAPHILLRREDMIFMGDDIFIVIDPPLEVNAGSVSDSG